jgi:hypothetical protein
VARYGAYADQAWAKGRSRLEEEVVAEMASRGVAVRRRGRGRLPLPRAVITRPHPGPNDAVWHPHTAIAFAFAPSIHALLCTAVNLYT